MDAQRGIALLICAGCLIGGAIVVVSGTASLPKPPAAHASVDESLGGANNGFESASPKQRTSVIHSVRHELLATRSRNFAEAMLWSPFSMRATESPSQFGGMITHAYLPMTEWHSMEVGPVAVSSDESNAVASVTLFDKNHNQVGYSFILVYENGKYVVSSISYEQPPEYTHVSTRGRIPLRT